MSSNHNFDTLQEFGDPLERVICTYRDELAPVLYPYADIWAGHICPRRLGDGSKVEAEWMPLAGSHYTALIRFFHAYRAHLRVLINCREFENGSRKAKLLLDTHSLFASFWEHLGSCVDNLALAFEDSPVTNMKEGEGRKYLQNKYERLSFAYDRRTQFVHSRLVPQRLDDGVLVFNVRVLSDKTTHWPAKHGREDEIVEEFHHKVWGEILGQLADAWHHLFNWIHNEDKKVPPLSFPVPMPTPVEPGEILLPDGPTPLSNIEFTGDEKWIPPQGKPGPSG